MIREDLSHNLVHLVKGDTPVDAVATFDKILMDRALIAGAGNIKGSWHCVCFTETPLAHLAQALSLRDVQNIRYYPAGIMVTKEWLFAKGGRPVIYQPDAEYSLLPEELKYRHVRYELDHAMAERTVDWTWEREWRIKTDRLDFTPEEVTLICPTRSWVNRLADAHHGRILAKSNYTENVMGVIVSGLADTAGIKRLGRFPWHCVALEDLGVPMPDDVSFEGD
jgi:hypothetical protein